MDRIDLVQDRDRWRAFINLGKKSWVPQNEGNFLTN
jgi:hypothetical protein